MIITENGVKYKIEGDYPDGHYLKVVITPPVPKTTMARSDFLDMLTHEELEALYTASENNVSAKVFIKLLEMKTVLRKDKVTAGLEAFVTAGVLAEERKNELLDWGNE